MDQATCGSGNMNQASYGSGYVWIMLLVDQATWIRLRMNQATYGSGNMDQATYVSGYV